MTIRLFSAALLLAQICFNAARHIRSDSMPQTHTGHEKIQEAAAPAKGIRGFSGGMMVHTGYISGCDNPYGYIPSGAVFGIGGVAKIHIGKHLRTGFEGYFSNLPLMGNGSFNKVFWTGALCDWYWQLGPFYPYVGLTAGGGMKTILYMFEGARHDWLPEPDAVFHKEPFFALDPFAGVEYAVGKAFRLTLKADWLMAFNKNGLNKPMGPRIYFGFIFAH